MTTSVLLADIYGVDDDSALSWMGRARCAEVDPELHFPEKGASTLAAKRICRGCEVRAECLEYALEHHERWGVWGGLSERERRGLTEKAPTGLCGNGLHLMDEKNAYVNPVTGVKSCRACKTRSRRQRERGRGYETREVAA